MSYSKDDLVKYRFERAIESFEEAKILAQTGHWNTVANRLYYSAFYAINALLAKQGIRGTTHSGVKSNFHREFIKTSVLNKEFGKLYNNLFNKRQEGDYQDFQSFDEDTVKPLIKKVEFFLDAIKQLI